MVLVNWAKLETRNIPSEEIILTKFYGQVQNLYG
jgi:hypothetical protein